MYLHLILAALFPIYAGSHASLRCPPSAAAPTQDDDGEEIEVAPPVEGLQPSDAIVFPVLAGTVLAGLYYIIKWLEDPAVSFYVFCILHSQDSLDQELSHIFITDSYSY